MWFLLVRTFAFLCRHIPFQSGQMNVQELSRIMLSNSIRGSRIKSSPSSSEPHSKIDPLWLSDQLGTQKSRSSAEQCRLAGCLVCSLHGAKHLEESSYFMQKNGEMAASVVKNPMFPNSVVWDPQKQDRSHVSYILQHFRVRGPWR